MSILSCTYCVSLTSGSKRVLVTLIMLLFGLWKVGEQRTEKEWPLQSLCVHKTMFWFHPQVPLFLFVQMLTLIFTLTWALVPSRSLNAACPQWIGALTQINLRPQRSTMMPAPAWGRGDWGTCPSVLRFSPIRALTGRTLLSAPTDSRACPVH